jgi:hypothetical protein
MYYIRQLDMFRALPPQEVKIVFLQHLVSSLSMSGRAVLSNIIHILQNKENVHQVGK